MSILVHWFLGYWCLFLSSAAWPHPISLIHGPKIPGSYTILFFVATEITFITRHINNWALYLLWSNRFLLSGIIGNFPLLLPCSILDTFRPGVLIFGVWPFWPFIQFIRFSQKIYWGDLPFPPPVNYVLSELSAITHPSWVVLQSMAHNFIELCKHLHHNKAMIHEGVTKLEYVEKQRHHSVDKGLYSKGYGLLSGHVWLWELDYKEGRMPKNWCLWNVLEKTPESPLNRKEIK